MSHTHSSQTIQVGDEIADGMCFIAGTDTNDAGRAPDPGVPPVPLHQIGIGKTPQAVIVTCHNFNDPALVELERLMVSCQLVGCSLLLLSTRGQSEWDRLKKIPKHRLPPALDGGFPTPDLVDYLGVSIRPPQHGPEPIANGVFIVEGKTVVFVWIAPPISPKSWWDPDDLEDALFGT